MNLEVTKTERTFTLTLSEYEAGVIKAVLGGICGGSPTVQTLYCALYDANVKDVGRSTGSYGEPVVGEDDDEDEG